MGSTSYYNYVVCVTCIVIYTDKHYWRGKNQLMLLSANLKQPNKFLFQIISHNLSFDANINVDPLFIKDYIYIQLIH